MLTLWPFAVTVSCLQDVRRLNDYFCEKEEEVVIMLQQLDEQTSAATTDHEKQLCHVGYIHLHGVHLVSISRHVCLARNVHT